MNTLPLFISWWQIYWLKKILLVVLLLLAFLGFHWIIQHPRWRHRLINPKSILLLLGFIASLPLIYSVAAKGLVVFLPTDSGAIVDAIVILGRSSELNRTRVDVATELWQAKRAPTIFVSAGGDAVKMIQLL